jgi:hypothetical protein
MKAPVAGASGHREGPRRQRLGSLGRLSGLVRRQDPVSHRIALALKKTAAAVGMTPPLDVSPA